MNTFCTKRLGIAVLLMSASLGSESRAADLLEPWDLGWSNLEVHADAGTGGEPGICAVIGRGFSRGFSTGLVFQREGGSDGAMVAALVAMWTRNGMLGGDLDLWGEVNVSGQAGKEMGWSVGLEWSRSGGPMTPYFRLGASREEGEVGLTPLVGTMAALTEDVDLHLEVAWRRAGTDDLPRLAIGPAWRISEGLEIVTDLGWNPGDDHERWSGSLGLVLDPRVIRRWGSLR